jgi:hypothetical protein
MAKMTTILAGVILSVICGVPPQHADATGVLVAPIAFYCQPDPHAPTSCNNLNQNTLTGINLILDVEGNPVTSEFKNAVIVVHGPDGSWQTYQTNSMGIPSVLKGASGGPGTWSGNNGQGGAGGDGGGNPGNGLGNTPVSGSFCVKTVTVVGDTTMTDVTCYG